MVNHFDLVLRSRRVMLPGAGPEGERAATVAVRDGVIAAVGAYDDPALPGAEDLGDLVLLPGLVDTHVHLNEPGREDWEGFVTGTAAAAAGGITTVIDMPLNSSPVTTTAEALSRKRQAARGKLAVDVGFHGGLIAGNAGRMHELIDAGVRGIKAFLCHSGIDEFPNATEADLREAMPVLAERGVPLLVHAELTHEVLVKPGVRDPRSYADYLASRPVSFERDAIALMIKLCRETRCRTHIVHLADAGCLPMLRDAKAEGLPLTVETCPQYLAFCAEEIADGRTDFKCAPPIRGHANREGLWQGLADGTLELIASDHSPCPPEMKALESGRFDEAWGGISSLQLGLSVVWSEAAQRGFSLQNVADWMGARPASLVGLPHGIALGHRAHLVVFDDNATFTVDRAKLHHRHPVTPYHGKTLRGVVQQTYVHGQPVLPHLPRHGLLI